MAYIHLITGGERSGKSVYAERLVLAHQVRPVYLATARVWDEEFRERIRRHQERRSAIWEEIEEEKQPSRHALSGRVVMLDCLTLWATNIFFDNGGDVDRSLAELKGEIDLLRAMDTKLYIVTNEIGMGGVSMDATQRKFTSLQGWINQYVAEHADRVTLMVSGIPINIKG